jgi:preprotein translocase subunit SecY
MLVYLTALLSIVAGTMFIMWLSEILTERGIGNGSSFIIFANILSSRPVTISSLYVSSAGTGWTGILKLIAVVVLFLIVIAFVILVQEGERRIPVQYSKKMVGRQMYGGQSSHIPIKVNIAGVMSIIFAISLLQFPSMIYQFTKPVWLESVVNALALTSPIGQVLYVIMIFMFTFFYTSFAINPREMAENMKKSGGFIPGIRPGKPTSDFIQKSVDRLSWIGALFYALIAMVPILFQSLLGINLGFSGTTLLIVTGVALELVKQLESQLLMRHYKGFLS